MKTSTDRILTTHVGSLARPTDLLDTMKEKEHGRPYDHALFDKQVREAVADRVRKQVENGIDIVADGEMSKVSFLGYVKDRLGGFEVEEGGSGPAPSWQVEIDMFPEYYADYMGKYSAAVAPLRRLIARGPISYVGNDLLQIDIDRGRRAPADQVTLVHIQQQAVMVGRCPGGNRMDDGRSRRDRNSDSHSNQHCSISYPSHGFTTSI